MASINAAEGDKFLLENRVKEGVQVTDSGLQYKVVVMGEGAKPASTDKVTVHYRGTLLNGEEFDSSYSRNQPTSFQLDQVIPGWTEGVQLMPVGSKFMFFIPPNLAYGPQGGGPIGPNSTLIFEVELLSID
jgi:FKBP-type peptidyl-prolyl cis-trans isomerase